MNGVELFYKVFEDADEVELYELEYEDGVTCYSEDLSERDGWYILTTISFRYNGKKYAFEKKEHSSDNVCDSEMLLNTFREVEADGELEKKIEKIINYIEQESYSTLEEIVLDLENLKMLVKRYVEE